MVTYWHDKAINPPKPREILELAFVYPALPPRVYSPNARVNWRTRHRESRTVEEDVSILIKEQQFNREPIADAIVSVKFGLPNRIKRDWDNFIARTKPIIDQLTRERILFDDSMFDYTPRYSWVLSRNKPFTEIKVYRVEYDD